MRRQAHDPRAGPRDPDRLRGAARARRPRKLPGVARGRPVHVRRAGIVVTGHRGALGDHLRPQRPVAVRAPARARRRRSPHIVIVGDRPEDLRAALRLPAPTASTWSITSGGLGPTADDLTAEVVAEFAGRADGARRGARGADLGDRRARCAPLARLDEEPMRAGAAQAGAACPTGATVLEPVGTAPGLLVGRRRPLIVLVLPGPPRELQPMWAAALATAPLRGAARRRGRPASSGSCACSGSRSRRSPRRCASSSAGSRSPLEITTCLRRGELEVATVFEPPARGRLRRASRPRSRERHADTLFSADGATIDDR